MENSYTENVYVVSSQRQFQCAPTKYVTENKERNYFEIYIFPSIMPIVFTSFWNIPKCLSSPVPVQFDWLKIRTEMKPIKMARTRA